MNIPYVMKRCTKCGRWLVASTVNFCRAKNGRYGLNSKCKECERKRKKQWREDNPEYDKQYREANKEKRAEYGKQYRQDNKEKIAEYNKQYYKANKEKATERNKQYREANKDKIAEYYKQYYEANKEKLAEYKRQYYEANKEKENERHKQWNRNNKEKIAEQHKQYRQTPQGQAVRFNSNNKRRHKEKAQGTGITGDQWLEMMKFFDFRCAYTGERITRKTKSIDHVVPIDAGGDDMVWNMVPMLRNLNSSKKAKDMLEWYKEQDFYDPKRLAKIYEWQEYAYNKYGKDTDYFNTNDIQIKLI